jgi:molecular chaperone GrpE (heat shock protein)
LSSTEKILQTIYANKTEYTLIVMTCYFRHMKDVFDKVGVTVTKDNKKEIDKTIHKIVGVEYKDCSATWKEVKKRIAENKEGFITTLKIELTKS